MVVDVHNPSSRAGHLFVTNARKIYHPLGFKKGYNFPFFIITCGALMGFVLARFQYFNFNGIFLKNVTPGEGYFFQRSHYRIGIQLHVITILLAAFFVCFQFVPVIRYKAMLFHRLNGYFVITLFLLGNVGAFMVLHVSIGGGVDTQLFLGSLGAITTVGIFLAWFNIKRLQIDQHRAWMLRTWSWAAAIISLRLIQLAANKVIENWWTFYAPIKCAQIWYMYAYYAGLSDANNPTPLIYRQCTGPESQIEVAVSTRAFGPGPAGPEHFAALARTTFTASGWLALIIHAILVELYLGLTPAESARLRMVSHERQLKAGMRHPEKGGLTATRLGDAPAGWNSPLQKTTLEKGESSESDSDLHHAKASTGTHAV